jgi:hypothetical protein
MKRSTLTALVGVACLAGCAQPDPPLLTLTGRSCDVAPVLSAAIPVPFDERRGATATFGASSPCLAAGGGRTVTYAVFQLPDTQESFQVTVASEVVGKAVVMPQASVYNASGTVVRTIAAGDFRPTITGFTAGLRTRAGDKLLLVSADPATIGEPTTLRLSARDIGTQVAATVFIPIIIAAPVYDQQKQHAATLSLNGLVRVSAAPIPIVP